LVQATADWAAVRVHSSALAEAALCGYFFADFFQYRADNRTITFEAWMSHNAGAISCCRQLLTGLLYVSTALRLLRRHYAGNFFDFVQYYVHNKMMTFEAWMSHNAGAIFCCRRLPTGTSLTLDSSAGLHRHAIHTSSSSMAL
jgi:hypothetical protein